MWLQKDVDEIKIWTELKLCCIFPGAGSSAGAERKQFIQKLKKLSNLGTELHSADGKNCKINISIQNRIDPTNQTYLHERKTFCSVSFLIQNLLSALSLQQFLIRPTNSEESLPPLTVECHCIGPRIRIWGLPTRPKNKRGKGIKIRKQQKSGQKEVKLILTVLSRNS